MRFFPGKYFIDVTLQNKNDILVLHDDNFVISVYVMPLIQNTIGDDFQNSMVNKRQRIPKGQSKMENPEKLATICVGHHYTQTNTNNVNKT